MTEAGIMDRAGTPNLAVRAALGSGGRGLPGAGRQRRPRRLELRCWASMAAFKRLMIGETMTISSLCLSTSIESGGRPNA